MSERLGAYTLVRPLGQGGMAEVYLGSAADGRRVAIKVLSAQRSLDAESCALFQDEARLVQLLDHENIASVLEVDVSSGRHYLAMEYVHGADLRDVLLASSHKHALPSYEVSLAIVARAAAGLDHAHRRCDPDGVPLHLVHRDVSLTNIMVGHDGTVKVVDFGIARSTLSSVHTSPGIVRGKASYMSPEQCLGNPLDHRTDVFALGIVLYELTTGVRCFAGKSDFDRMLAVVQGDYLAPSDLVADYPPELEQVVRTALAAAPEHRYPSCAALILALEGVMAGRGWRGDAEAIRRAMHELFGDVQAPRVAAEEAPRTIEHVELRPISALPTAKLTRPRRFGRGTAQDLFDARHSNTDEDDDARTRGPRSIRRASSPFLAA